jgi:hypothetical protein
VSGPERRYIPEAMELCFARMVRTPFIVSTYRYSLFRSWFEDAGTNSIIRLSAKLEQ